MNPLLALLSMLFPYLPAVSGSTQDLQWNQWRGPERDGQVPTEAWSIDWPQTLSRDWRVEVGEGHSSPVTDAQSVYVLTRVGEEEVVQARSLADGSERWSARRAVDIGINQYATGHGRWPRATPLLAAGKLYTLGATAVLQCFDTNTGDLLWCRDDFGEVDVGKLFCGTSASPILAEGSVIVYTGDDRGGALRALDPASGADRWTTALEGPGYASAILDVRATSPGLLTMSERRVLAIDPRSGVLQWSYEFPDEWQENIVTPLLLGEHDVLISGIRRGTLRLSVPDSKDPAAAPTVVWAARELALYMNSPVLFAGRIVALDPRRRGALVSLDPESGEFREEGPRELGENASLLVAGDALIVVTTTARVSVFRAAGTELETVHDYDLELDPIWAHPAPVQSGLVLKDSRSLSRWRAGES